MDHFDIMQQCVHCFRGGKRFRVDLTCYDVEGRLIIQPDDMDRFRFICRFCLRESTLDFYGFFDQNFISFLKNLHRRNVN